MWVAGCVSGRRFFLYIAAAASRLVRLTYLRASVRCAPPTHTRTAVVGPAIRGVDSCIEHGEGGLRRRRVEGEAEGDRNRRHDAVERERRQTAAEGCIGRRHLRHEWALKETRANQIKKGARRPAQRKDVGASKERRSTTARMCAFQLQFLPPRGSSFFFFFPRLFYGDAGVILCRR